MTRHWIFRLVWMLTKLQNACILSMCDGWTGVSRVINNRIFPPVNWWMLTPPNVKVVCNALWYRIQNCTMENTNSWLVNASSRLISDAPYPPMPDAGLLLHSPVYDLETQNCSMINKRCFVLNISSSSFLMPDVTIIDNIEPQNCSLITKYCFLLNISSSSWRLPDAGITVTITNLQHTLFQWCKNHQFKVITSFR